MMNVFHLNAGAARRTDLVLDDRDRLALVRCAAQAFEGRLLAYCVMDTHLHVVAEGSAEETERVLTEALRVYARGFNARHGHEGRLRGPVVGVPSPSDAELAAQVRYVHRNPLDTRDPIEREVAYEWSSARAYAGLSRASFPNVARARELMGRHARSAGPFWRPAFADLEPAPVPYASPALILAATAQAFGVAPEDVSSTGRAPALVAARGAYVRLGRLESYVDGQLAPLLGRTRQRISQIGSEPVDINGVRIARTILRTSALRERLRQPQICRSGKPKGPSRHEERSGLPVRQI